MAHISCYRAFFFQSLTLLDSLSKVILLTQLFRQFDFSFVRSPCNHRVGDRPYQMNLNFFSSEADQPKKRFFNTLLFRNPPQFWFFLSLFPRLDTNHHKNTQVMVWLTVCCFRSTFRIPKMHR